MPLRFILHAFAPNGRKAAAAFAAMLCSTASAFAADVFVAKPICDCIVSSLSADGSAAAGRLKLGEAFLWTNERGLERLGGRPYDKDRAYLDDEGVAISRDGRRVASTISEPRHGHAVQGLWTRARGWQVPRVLPPDAVVEDRVASVVSGLSPDGAMVLGYYIRASGGKRQASAWTAAGLQDMGSSGGHSRVHGASADGTVLVGVDGEPTLLFDRAAVWSGGTRQWITDSRPSQALAVNAAGDTIVGTAVDQTGEYAAALWSKQGEQWLMQTLGRLPGADGYALATGVSDDGRVVVGHAAWRDALLFSNQTGFVWTAQTGLLPAADYFGGRPTGIDANYRIHAVAAISADGQVMGVVARKLDSITSRYRSYLVRRVDGGSR
jgi:hypothetical protein